MTTDLFLRSIVPGAYLVALVLNGRFDPLVGSIIVGMVLIWAAPQLRRMVHRREKAPRTAV
jgi:hypothetical protein